MDIIIKNITEADFYLQLQALSAQANILRELGLDQDADQVEVEAQTWKKVVSSYSRN